MNSKRGFTLIELIVVIAVIAMLSITISVSSQKMMENTRYSSYRNTYEEIFEAARIYSNLYSVPSNCNKCVNNNTCTVTINCLIQKGLLDEDIVNQINPKTCTKFLEEDTIKVTTSNSIKKESYSGISSDNIDDYESWGKC